MNIENIQAPEASELPKPRFGRKKKAEAVVTRPPSPVQPEPVEKPKRTRKTKKIQIIIVPEPEPEPVPEPVPEKPKRKRRTKAEIEASRAEAGPSDDKKGRGRPRKPVDPNEPPKEKQKRGRKKLAEPKQINTTGSAKYNQMYYTEKRVSIARRRLIKKLENGEHVSSKMLLKYGLATTE